MTPDVERAIERLRFALKGYPQPGAEADLDFVSRHIDALELLADGPQKKKKAPSQNGRDPGLPVGGLEEFLVYAEHARDKLKPGKVDWEDSPLGWIRRYGPRPKSSMAKDIFREWLGSRVTDAGAGLAHFYVDNEPTTVHFGTLGANAKFEFSQLLEDGFGVERILLLGVEPARVRVWEVEPRVVGGFPSWGQQVDGLHHCTFDPEELEPWLTEIACWEESS